MPKPAWTLALILLVCACGREESPVAKPPREADPATGEEPKSPQDVTRLVLEKKIEELQAEIAAAEAELADLRAKMKADAGDQLAALQEEAVALEKKLIDLETELAGKKQVLSNLGG